MKKLFLTIAILLMAVPAMAAEAKFSWMAAVNAEGYLVHFGTSPTEMVYSVNTRSATQYTISDLKCGTLYYFNVTAYRDNIESPPSNTIQRTTPDCMVIIVPERWDVEGLRLDTE